MKSETKNRLYKLFAPCCGYLAEDNESTSKDSTCQDRTKTDQEEHFAGFKVFTDADNCGPHIPMNCPKRRKFLNNVTRVEEFKKYNRNM